MIESFFYIIYSQLNSRELAIVVWMIIWFLWIRVWKRSKLEFLPILKALFSKVFIYYYIAFLAYIWLKIYLLNSLWLIFEYIYKDLLFWIFWALYLALYNIERRYISFKDYLFSKIFQLFSFSAILSFISNIYTFSFFAELIIQPFLFSLVLLVTISWNKPEYKESNILFSIIFNVVIIFLIYFIIVNIITSPNFLFKLENIYKYVLPFMLSILLFPFLYFLALFQIYERLYIKLFKLSKALDNSEAKRWFREILLLCKFNFIPIEKYFNSSTQRPFIATQGQLNEMINQIKFYKYGDWL